MMKFARHALLATTLLGVMSTQAVAADAGKAYLRLDGGYSVSSEKLKEVPAGVKLTMGNSPAFALGAGYHITDNIRADVTVQYAPKYDLKSSLGLAKWNKDIKSLMSMVNAYYDITSLSQNITPYVGVGVGMAHLSSSTLRLSVGDAQVTGKITEKENRMVIKGTVGTAVRMTDALLCDVSYSYVHFADKKSSNVKLNAHDMMVGVRYVF